MVSEAVAVAAAAPALVAVAAVAVAARAVVARAVVPAVRVVVVCGRAKEKARRRESAVRGVEENESEQEGAHRCEL